MKSYSYQQSFGSLSSYAGSSTVQVQNQSFFQEGYIEVEKVLMLSSARNSIREQFSGKHINKKRIQTRNHS
jgi:hypothetical protein